MGMSTERILYPTLTRPVLIKGVPRDWALLSGFTFPPVYVFSSYVIGGLWPLFLAGLTLGVMWVSGLILARFLDPEFLSILLLKRVTIRRTQGPGPYTGNRYWS